MKAPSLRLATGGQRLFIGVVALVVLVSIAQGQQTTGDILGTVTDISGAVVAHASVTIENLGTRERRTTQTSDNGEFVVNLLNPGDYSLTVTAPGFKTYSVPSLRLAAGDRSRINAALALGQTTETITVEAQVSALQTDSSVLSHTIEQKQTQDLPLNGRNFIQLIQLAPGANEGPPDSLSNGSKLDDRRQTASISVNGQSDVLNNQMIDGVDNNERLIGTVAVRPSVEAIGEMRVQTNTYTAEVGRTGGGIINVVTKSGTNSLHGSLFEFLRNDIFDATNYDFGANLPKSELRQNDFGGSLGGPIRKDKTFFFGDYEGLRIIQGRAPQTSTVPSLAARQNPGVVNDPGQGPNFGPGPIDPAGLAYFQMFPAPNAGPTTFVGADQETQYNHAFDVRVDHSFDTRNTMYARFTYNNTYTNTPGTFPKTTVAGVTLNPSFIGSGLGFAKDVDYNGMLNFIHTFNGNLLLELKAAYTRADNQSYPNTDGQNPNAAFGQPNVNTPISDSTGLAPVVVAFGLNSNLGQTLFQPLKDQDNTYQYLGSVSYTHGAHNIKIGGAVARRQLTSFQSSYPEGFWIFLSFADLLQGKFVNMQRSLQLAPPHLRVWEPSVYAQDDWRVNKKLTLNLGLRYDLFTPFTETDNRISTFDPVTGALLVAGQNGVSDTAGIKTDYRGLAPRVGFAYSPGAGLVVRGGYGIGFFPMNTTSNANLKNAPFVSSIAGCGFFNCGTGLFGNGLPAPVPSSINDPNASIPDAVDPHFRTSYLEQFNLTVQKEWGGNVATVSYVGILGRDLAQLYRDLNAPPPNTCGSPGNPCTDPNTLRPYFAVHPNLGLVGFFTTHGKSSYNSLQASFERRLKAGLTLNANYNWSHSLDNATGLSEENAGGMSNIPLQTSTRDYGNSVLDLRQRFALTATYQLPFGKNSSGARGILAKGWQFNVITAWETGNPYTVTNATDVSGAFPGSNNVDRPDMIGNPVLSNPSVSEFFNIAAFAPQTAGTVGDERRNALFGPHFRHADVSLFKVFDLTERANLEFRAECFNLSNTPNFATPNASLGAGGFGSITAMNFSYAPRQIQFALKLRF